MADYATRRRVMVDTQVRTSDVTKFPIIEAMLDVPRELFVPPSRRDVAYLGENIPLGGGRVLLEPRTFAKMLDGLNIQPHEAVLDIGCGQGYSAAVIARLAEAVVAVEDVASLADEAETVLAAEGFDNAAVVSAPLIRGAPEHGPYDAITIEGAAEVVPESLIAQLKDGGRIACIFMEGALGVARLGFKTGDRVSWRYAFNAGAPILPGFGRSRAFAL